MVQLQFEDPPEYQPTENRHPFDTKKNGHREELVNLLTEYPNRWAVVSKHLSRTRANQVAAILRTRHNHLHDGPGTFEFCARTKERAGVVYGRYVVADVNLEA